MHDVLRQDPGTQSPFLMKCSQSVLGSACTLNLQNSLDQHGGAHLSLNTWKEEVRGLCEFQASLCYIGTVSQTETQ